MDLTKREKMGLVGFVIIILVITSFFYFRDRASSSIEVIKNKNISSSLEDTNDTNGITKDINNNTAAHLPTKSSQIYVYITGEIKNPGVYILNEGDRVERLISKAGGLTSKADTLSINLASKLKDEDHIEVYSKGVLGSTGVGVMNGNAMNPQLSSSTNEAKININSADKEQLKELPRVGDAISQRIIDYRTQNGKFNNIKDITNVSGIGPKLYDGIKDKISVQ